MQVNKPNKEKGYDYLQTLYVVNDMLKQAEADGLDINYILPRILRVAAVELNASSGSIIIIDPDLNIEYGWTVDGENSYQTKYWPFLEEVIKHGIAGIATRTHKSITIDNTLEDSRWLTRPNHVTALEPWSAISTPLIARQRAVGAITITKPGIKQFDQDDLNLLQAIASQAAVTIENARLFAASQRQLKEAELFNEASKAINSSLDIKEIMAQMLRQMNELIKAEAISIALVEENELVYTVADGVGSEKIVGLRLPSNEGVSGWVMEYAQPVLVHDPETDDRFNSTGDRRTGTVTKAMICAPLEAHGRVLGTIQAINPLDGNFSRDDLRILTRLAGLASGALAKAEQYEMTEAAERRYTNLFEDSIDPILITDVDGRIQEINHRASEFLGYGRQQLLGENINCLHANPIFAEATLAIGEVAETIKIITTSVLTKDTIEIPVEVHTKRTVGREYAEIQWIYHDISKQVELEQMRNDLTAMLFHDLQNPLSNIMSSLELLDMELGDLENEIVDMMLVVANRSSHRLRHLIRSLLDINQLEAGAPIHEKALVDSSDMFDYVREMIEAAVERKHIKIATEIGDDVPDVFANKDMIERVLINMSDNAVKFSKRGDTISLRAEITGDGNYVHYSVSDEGPGIPKKFRKTIFDKFYRAPNNTSKGIGLGLAFCRLAVEAHGGRIWADEAKGGGAKFNFTIPISHQK